MCVRTRAGAYYDDLNSLQAQGVRGQQCCCSALAGVTGTVHARLCCVLQLARWS